ncbi:MAG: hypothetical protein J2P17_05105 [Mycobacterium sp.]|nr:hypothetical protein [Mycobacterium sp.]
MEPHVEEFGERFMREQSSVIDVNGTQVWQRKAISDVPPNSIISIAFEQSSTEVEQALCVATSHGFLKVAGQRAKQIALWTGSAPRKLEVEITNRVPTEVVAWNAWRRSGGGTDAGLRYAGMLIDQIGETSWRLQCSDGIGGPDFTDLIVVIGVHSQAGQSK